jgi:hypothetical protein
LLWLHAVGAVIVTGEPFTVIEPVDGEPQPVLYEIVAVPEETPVTTPEVGCTVAIPESDDDHTPPVVAQV